MTEWNAEGNFAAETKQNQAMNMSRIIVMMVAVMATAANVAAQDITGQVEQEQDSVTLSINDTIALKDVEVVTMRQLVKTLDDRVSYNVQADLEARTSTVLDVLRRVPLVSVDGQDNVRVNGSGSFKIYKNGHPDPAEGIHPLTTVNRIRILKRSPI